ncbi:AP-2 complex subunit alpha-1-like isoform X1 [Selaginella moellendorffii]|uniref:AP-2 complex subunit alpha-1-like isoform X1 n=1 Tax=Selaginella moellendorffii TaxID=88036 RepID=UPI000D1CCD14|nr:AP-2 complex subunit alpha-1-like isoform X1 [Selaginella moellendorffii]|eukprot:XP_024540037.1 AP-2 complex subunit alpha-1-like isoform X1 [Selaginella moellendorffii]
MAMASMRGLQMFITDVRNCQSKDQEMARVEKELNKIRMKFSYEKSLSSYEKKKYVWKLLYIHILGYQLDFGHREVLSLVGSHKYAEKQVGYMVAGCLLHENHEFLNLITKAIRLDIIGRSETYQCLALTMIGNIGGRDFAEALAPDVQKLVALFLFQVSGSCRPLVRKKAILCLLHIYRKHPEVIQLDIW